VEILILGAGGFVGANLVEHLLRVGEHRLVAVDRTPERLDELADPSLQVHAVDVHEDRERAADLVREADVVVNLVTRTGPATAVRAPLQVIESALLANLATVDACVRHGRRLIQFSTCEVYGLAQGEGNIEEGAELRLGPVQETRWTYAAAYQMLERLIHGHGLAGQLEYTIFRPFNLIGPRYDPLVPAGTMGGPRLFAHFMSALLSGGPMYLVDGGLRRRTFTHIADLNDAVTLVLGHPGARNQVFNVGNPANTCRVRDVAELMRGLYAELTGRESTCPLVEVPGATFYGEGFADADRAPPDVRRLRALGWEPRHDLRRTFRDAISWYLAQSAEGAVGAARDAPLAAPSGRWRAP
jgi:UDP-apiose/xylose synthase